MINTKKKDVPVQETSHTQKHISNTDTITQTNPFHDIENEIPFYIKEHRRNIFHALPKELREFILKSAKQIDAPEEVIFLAMLSVVSSAIGNSLKLQLKSSWIESPILFCGVIAEASSGKTPAINIALKPLAKYQINLKKQYDEDMLLYKQNQSDFEAHKGEKYQKGVKPSQLVPMPNKPVFSQVIVQDATIEALREVFQFNTRGLLLHADEMSGWLNSLNQYKSGKGNDKQQWLEIYNGAMLTYNRVGKEPLVIDEPFISIIGGIQTDVAHKILNADNEADGFSARFLFIKPDTNIIRSSFNDEIEGYEAAFNHYERVINTLLSIPLNTERLHFTDDAKNYFGYKLDTLKEKQRSGVTASNWKAVYGKLNTYAARLCIVLHALNYANNRVLLEGKNKPISSISHEIELETVIQVWEYLIPYFENELKLIYEDQELTQSEKVEKRIREIIHSSDDIFVTETGLKAIPTRKLLQAKPFGKGSHKNTKQILIDYVQHTNPNIGLITSIKEEGKSRAISYFVLKDPLQEDD